MTKAKILLFSCLMSCGLSYAQISVNTAPITLTIENYSDLDLEPVLISQKNFNNEDVAVLQTYTFYAHKEKTFIIRRTGYPASLYINFLTSSREGGHGRLPIARWEYIEHDNMSVGCHDFKANSPYYIGCSSNNNFNAPNVTIGIGHVHPTSQPLTIPSP